MPPCLLALASRTPRGAVEALTASARVALQCVAQAEVLSSGTSRGRVNNLVVVSSGNTPANTLLLRRSDRSPYLHLEISTEFDVVALPDVSAQRSYQAAVTMYMYAVKDLNDRELFTYHWHPVGLSRVRTPHLHYSSATPISLPNRRGSSSVIELDMSNAHFPTHRIELAELVRFLIRDFGVAPRRQDWERVLDRL